MPRFLALLSLFLFSSCSHAQDAKQQRINQAIDAAERLCLVGTRYKFSANISGSVTILKLLPGGQGQVIVDNAEGKGGQFFENETVRRNVDQDIRECMKSQWPEVLKYFEYKRIACTGEYESSCPGAHDAFYTCDFAGSDADVGAKVCGAAPASATRINTTSGNRCGYALIEITCN